MMPHSRTHQDPEQLTQATAAKSVARNAHGQSLDDARETFRAEWQAKIDHKRQQAKRAANNATWCGELAARAALAGPAVGACLCALFGLLGGMAGFFMSLLIGGLLGYIAVLPLLVLCYGTRWSCRWWVQRLEREAEELERS
jgi:hypothetical protein